MTGTAVTGKAVSGREIVLWITRGIGAVDERIVFVSPPLKNMQLQRVSQPRGATALVSNKKNVELARGIMLELRQAEP